ncbi:MAG: SLC13 family permease [Deltaproteobacteria bacterium]|nr:MAG: SLC13 family permease [Deltaproteobacteria bacterium]
MLTLIVIVGALLLMMANVLSPDIILLGGVVVLAAAGILTPAEAFSGFSNTGMLTIAALFVVAAGLKETGAVQVATARLLGVPGSERGALVRLVAPVVVASAFLNNTTIVATLLQAVHDWAQRIRISPARLLMPLSFASILGGTCTLLGTSTNLVVAGLVHDLLPTTPGLHEIGMFEMTPLGVVVALAGSLILVVAGPWLLPDRRPPVSVYDDPRQYTMELLVPPGSRLSGLTVEEAGLRHLPGAFLMEIVRGDDVLAAVDAHQRLAEGDRLVFVGDITAMVDLQRMPGLVAAPDQVFKLQGDRIRRRIVEAVVSERNPIVGRTIRDGGFRRRYQAVVIAVARAGERLAGRIGDIVLRPGDVLLLEAGEGFVDEHRRRSDFVLVSSVEGASPPRYERAGVAGLILAALVAAITLQWMPAVTAAFLGGMAMLLTRCCTLEEARRSLDLTVLVAIAAAFGLGRAMHTTGLDREIADLVVTVGADSPLAALAAVYLVTVLLTEVVTNNAAAVLAIPIAMSLAERLDVAPMGFVIAVMMAASASFLTPIGYQTNLMVFNAGGYRPLDYLRLGAPISLAAGILTVVIVPWLWPF